MPSKLLLVLVAAVLGIISSADAQCTSLITTRSSLALLPTLRSCARQIAFTETLRTSTLETTSRFMDSYSFRDINADSASSGSPFSIKVDIVNELATIGTKSYSSASDFQDDIARVMLSMGDAHTAYVKPYCLHYSVVAPIILGSEVRNGAQVVYVAGKIASAMNNYLTFATGFSQATLDTLIADKSQVVSINGVPAIDAVVNRMLIISKNEGARFNDNLSKIFSYTMSVEPFPSFDEITLVLKKTSGDQVTLKVPLVGAFDYAGDMNPAASDFCTTTPSSTRRKSLTVAETSESTAAETESSDPRAAAIARARKQLKRFDGPMMRSFAPLQRVIQESTENLLETMGAVETGRRAARQSAARRRNHSRLHGLASLAYITEGDYFSLIEVVGSTPKTCVVYIPSFNFGEECADDDCFGNAAETAVLEMLQVSKDLYGGKCDYAIIDVIANGGGVVCLGYLTLSVLFSGGPKSADGLHDFLISSWMPGLVDFCNANDLVKECGSGNYLDASGAAFKSTDFVRKGETITRGGKTSKYSYKTKLDCSPFFDAIADLRPKVAFPPQRLAIVSDGTCGSTCHLFATRAQTRHGVTVVGVGGLKGSPLAVASFPGGNVLSSAETLSVLGELKTAGLDLTNFPKNYTTSAQLSYNFREVYPTSPAGSLPSEFTLFKANQTLDQWLQQSPTTGRVTTTASIYQGIIDNVFSKIDGTTKADECSDGQALPCPDGDDDNGAPCVDGKADYDQCGKDDTSSAHGRTVAYLALAFSCVASLFLFF